MLQPDNFCRSQIAGHLGTGLLNSVDCSDPAKAASETEAPDWVMLGSLFGVGNLLLLLIAGTAYWWVKKNNSRDHIQLLDDEDETAVKGVAG